MNNKNEKYERVKITLKIVGLSMLSLGLIFSIIGFISFFKAFNEMEQPKLFFFCFIGLPLMGIGGGITMMGFRKEILQYSKNESIDVITETSRSVAKAVNDEINNSNDVVKCISCGAENKKGSKFCNECGEKIDGNKN